jgi:hypothetical protein
MCQEVWCSTQEQELRFERARAGGWEGEGGGTTPPHPQRTRLQPIDEVHCRKGRQGSVSRKMVCWLA